MNLEKLLNLANDLPDAVKENAVNLVTRMGEVIEGIGDEPVVWRPSYLRIVQGTTDRTKLPKGTGIGDLIIGENKMESPLKVIPLRMHDARQFWSPDPNENKMLCSSPDSKFGYIGNECRSCPHSQFNEETKKSECAKMKTVMVVLADLSDVIVVNFSKTNYSVGREWETTMKKAAVLPYRRTYGLSAKTNTAYKNIENYDVQILDAKERNTPSELIPFLTELFTQVGEDRKETLVKFYEFIKNRKESGAPALANSADSEMTLITSDEVAVEAPQGAEMATKYEV